MSPKGKAHPTVDLYIRVSDVGDRGGDSFISPADQEKKARALCDMRGYEVGGVYIDLNEGGGKMDRPQFNEVMRRARAGESDGIVVAKLDRFARNVKGLLEYIDELEAAGAIWACAEPTIDTADPTFGRFLLTLFGAMAELERGRIGRSWEGAKANAVETRGLHISRFCPPGYERPEEVVGTRASGSPIIKVTGPLVPHPIHGATLREAYEMAARGVSYARIADHLTERGFPSGGEAATWGANRVSRLLANRVYLGEARYGDITNPGAHEALVDAKTWARAQRKSKAAPPRTASALLAGLARCECCRYALRGSKSSTRVATYECRPGSRPGERCESPAYVSMGRLDEYVLEAWLARSFAAATIYTLSVPTTSDAQTEAVEEARAAFDQVAALEGTLPAAVYAAARDAALRSLEAAEIAAFQPVVGQAPGVDLPDLNTLWDWLNQAHSNGERFRDRIAAEDIPSYRELMARDIRGVFVRPAASRNPNLPIADRVRIVWAGEEMPELPQRGRRGTKAAS